MTHLRRIRISLLGTVTLILMSCGTSGPTESEIKHLIRTAYGLPALEASGVRTPINNSPISLEIQRLFREGYILPQFSERDGHVIAPKGKNLIKNIFTDAEPSYFFQPYTNTIDVIKVTQILLDSKSGTAEAQYQLGISKTEYGIKLMAIDPGLRRRYEEYERSFPRTRTVRLKRWDQGWRLATSSS